MTEEFDPQIYENQKKGQNKCKQPCIVALGILLAIIFILCIIILILALTVFKIKDPKIEVLSVAVDGIALVPPSHFFKYKFNITLDLKIQVENPNRASFRHEAGKSELT
ncbi:putative Late [Abeliophyllum distichum]|uniref:Late n=1 Tax=Abeliophyllum distichum TaxID=126358 RepID=A0ABD1P1Y5_9LAMI